MKYIGMAALVALGVVSSIIAQEIRIDSMAMNGSISFSGVQVGSTAEVEWAASLVDVGRTNWHTLSVVPVTNASMTSDIPMFFRVRGTAQQTLFTNGGFELPAISSNTFAFVVPEGWTTSPSWGVLFNGDGGNSTVWPQPSEGKQYMDIGNNDSMWLSQTVSVSRAGNYTLTWYDNTGIDYGAPALASIYSVTVAHVGGEQTANVTNDAWHVGVWTRRRLDLILSAGDYVLTFTPLGSRASLDTLLDDVRLVQNW